MKTKLPLLSLFLFFSHFAFSQSDFRPGYVILNSGDTLYGTIDYRGDLSMSAVCKYKAQEKGEEVEYFPKDIKAYRFKDSKYFISKEVTTESGTQKAFLEFLIKGEINAYAFRDQSGQHYFIEKEGGGLAELAFKEEIRSKDNGPYLHQKDNGLYLYQSKKHIGILKFFMQDAPSLNSKIEKLDKIGHKNIIEITEEYHNQVCPQESCIIFEKKVPRFRIHPELVLRNTHFHNKSFLTNHIDRNYISSGVLLHIQVPSLNEKLYFSVGVLPMGMEKDLSSKSFRRMKENESTMTNFTKFPFYLSYLYPKGTVRPRISYGLNLYSSFAMTNSLTAGANIKLYKFLSLSLHAETEFLPYKELLIIPQGLFSYSFGTGLYFAF